MAEQAKPDKTPIFFDGIICYRRKDETGFPSGVYLARLIHENLKKCGLNPYLDVENGKASQNYRKETIGILKKANYCMFILTPYTFQAKTVEDDDVINELKVACSRCNDSDKKPFVFLPIIPDNCFSYDVDIPDYLDDSERKLLKYTTASFLSINNSNFHAEISLLANYLEKRVQEQLLSNDANQAIDIMMTKVENNGIFSKEELVQKSVGSFLELKLFGMPILKLTKK